MKEHDPLAQALAEDNPSQLQRAVKRVVWEHKARHPDTFLAALQSASSSGDCSSSTAACTFDTIAFKLTAKTAAERQRCITKAAAFANGKAHEFSHPVRQPAVPEITAGNRLEAALDCSKCKRVTLDDAGSQNLSEPDGIQHSMVQVHADDAIQEGTLPTVIRHGSICGSSIDARRSSVTRVTKDSLNLPTACSAAHDAACQAAGQGHKTKPKHAPLPCAATLPTEQDVSPKMFSRQLNLHGIKERVGS
eukprot:jgi/Chrzof1/190/Cz01g06140.t1